MLSQKRVNTRCMSGLIPWQELQSLSWRCGRFDKVSHLEVSENFSTTLWSRAKSPRFSERRLTSVRGPSCRCVSALYKIHWSNSFLIASNTDTNVLSQGTFSALQFQFEQFQRANLDVTPVPQSLRGLIASYHMRCFLKCLTVQIFADGFAQTMLRLQFCFRVVFFFIPWHSSRLF